MHDSFSPIGGTKSSDEVLGTQGMCFYLIASVALSHSHGGIAFPLFQPHGWDFELSIVPLAM